MRTPLLLALLGACSGSDPAPDVVAARQLPAALKEDATAVARASNQFACDLYNQLATGDGNRFFSPFSISTALAMTDAGAAGTTDLELRTALHLDLPGDRAHKAVGALLASLDTGRGFGAYTLDTANGMFGQIGFPFRADFIQTMTSDYGAELTPVDFEHAPEAARTTVNAWVASHTDDKIPELFGPGTIDASARLALANAIVFKGTWALKFRPDTAAAPFHLATGQTVQVPMMQKSEQLVLAAIPGGSLGILPFRGNDLSMVILLPDQPDGLPAIEAQLTGDAIAQWIASARSQHELIPVLLPRFSLETSTELPDALAALGVISAFDQHTADFSGIDGQRDLYLQAVVHKAVIKVDENGAEAAAATGVVAVPASVPSPFAADRPFVFFIYDHVTNTILFLGRVTDPTA
jgi:serpin B